MITVQVAERLVPFAEKRKRVKIAVGGRGGSKSIAFADMFLKYAYDGETLCCAREFQNSIEDSVHSLLSSRIEALKVQDDFNIMAKEIHSRSGGKLFYKGLSRNILSIKSMFGVNKIWVEEAQGLSNESITTLIPTIRENNSELWFSLNRGSSKDPFSKRMLEPYEKAVRKHGFYEDEDILIVEINWQDNPFFPVTMDKDRRRDKELMSEAEYNHIWEGYYSDTVDNAIIIPEWFDACIDAHKVLGFEPEGQEIISYDPADTGDAKAIAHIQGSIVKEVKQNTIDSIDTGTDWALSYTVNHRPDVFSYDADGIGGGLKRQIEDALQGKKIQVEQFKGSQQVDRPDETYQDSERSSETQPKTNKQMFTNKRAQYYWLLRERMFKTWQAVKKGKYINPDELISISSDIEELNELRAEVCRIPRKYIASGRIQLMPKHEMKTKLKIESPNMADALMMAMRTIDLDDYEEEEDYEYQSASGWMG